ncbi:MAG: ROK family protein [Trueperaceae bacterium]|nr:MAG: ROK family protein [Trueperaceae bacterium]
MPTWVIGADLGATKIELGLVDPQDRIRARQRIATDAHKGPRDVVERIAQSVTELKRALPVGESLASLGICSPGPLDHQSGTLLDPPNLPGLHHTPLRQLLIERLELPVALEHDAKAAALGEFHYGAGRDEESMVFIVVGTGVGAAIIEGGNLYRGSHNSAGEVGHITLNLHGETCHCGSRGCAETFVSGPSLAKRYLRTLPPQNARRNAEEITGERVVQLAAGGDASAHAIVLEAGEALGAIVATLAMILDIELYVIGGSVSKAGDLLLQPARQAVPNYSFASVGSRVRIEATGLENDGPVLGCSWLARRALDDGYRDFR